MTKLPRHINLTIEHQPQAINYQSVAQWLEQQRALDSCDVLPQDEAEMLRTGEVWEITWYPDTPVGHCSVAAATLERALELANS